jgi:RNA polymerase sigma-70 factor (ECF subfamily)
VNLSGGSDDSPHMSTREELEHELLVVRCQIGERQALSELVDQWHSRLAGYVGGMLTNTAIVDDVVQEIWISVFRSLPGLKEPSKFASWVYTIARRSIMDRLRTNYRTPDTTHEMVDDGVADDRIVGLEDRVLIGSALSDLPPIDREVAWLVLIEDRPLAEVARITEVPVGTVKSRMHRARRQLRVSLESKGFRQ